MIVLLAAPILLTLTLLISGLTKLGARRGTEDAMTSLRIPLRSWHPSIATLLPAAEIVLALALWFPVVPLQVLVATLIALLLMGYLVIIARALGFDEKVECSCFGTLASPSVSMTTLARNIILAALGVLTLITAAQGLLTEALVQAPLGVVSLGAALLTTVVLTALTIGGADTSEADDDSSTTGSAIPPRTDSRAADVDAAPFDPADPEVEGELLDYERTPTPAAVVQRADGRLVTLRELTRERAALLIFVSEGCGPCERVLDRAPEWIDALSAQLQVLFVFSRPLEKRRATSVARVGDHALFDPEFTARTHFRTKSSPSAVLLGADGQLAGGPVSSGSGVIDFVEEIREELRAAMESGELEAAPAEGAPSTGE